MKRSKRWALTIALLVLALMLALARPRLYGFGDALNGGLVLDGPGVGVEVYGTPGFFVP